MMEAFRFPAFLRPAPYSQGAIDGKDNIEVADREAVKHGYCFERPFSFEFPNKLSVQAQKRF